VAGWGSSRPLEGRIALVKSRVYQVEGGKRLRRIGEEKGEKSLNFRRGGTGEARNLVGRHSWSKKTRQFVILEKGGCGQAVRRKRRKEKKIFRVLRANGRKKKGVV